MRKYHGEPFPIFARVLLALVIPLAIFVAYLEFVN
jgi:hypothetical protein